MVISLRAPRLLSAATAASTGRLSRRALAFSHHPPRRALLRSPSQPAGYHFMANYASKPSPFTRSIVSAMRSLYPEELADRSWDNIGLLLENSASSDRPCSQTVLLTNDLTLSVTQEAIEADASVIVTYHPIIFRGLKSITHQDPQQDILLRLARANIAVYSPHTAVDAARHGLNDWLADIVAKSAEPWSSATRSVVKKVSVPGLDVPEGVGYGRIIRFQNPVQPDRLLPGIADGLGVQHMMVAKPAHGLGGLLISSVAVCAGSGWDVLKDCDADMFVTGEMSHHNALHTVMRGKWAVTMFHSNSERRYLEDVMRGRLQDQLRKDGVESKVVVSVQDRDPFEVWSGP